MTDRPVLIFAVDDEPELLETVEEFLTRNRFTVRTAGGGAELDALLAVETPDLILLDINMPGENGLEIARRLRATGGVPIIMLTAADDVVDKIVGLEIGADDYITKPFDLRELKTRIRTVLRRAAAPAFRPDGPRTPARGQVRFGRVNLDLEARCLVTPDGRSLPLTTMEFDLLHVFIQNPNRVLTRDRLLDLTNTRSSDPFDRSIDIRMVRIRRKVETDPANPQFLKTVRGAGYMYVPATGDSSALGPSSS